MNHLPIAVGGEDQIVEAGSFVTLDGRGSTDVDDGITSFRWVQVAGEPVSLSGAGEAITSFVAPENGAGKAPLVFRLTVQDAGGLQHNTQVTVTVTEKKE